jgi:hypothetical protein
MPAAACQACGAPRDVGLGACPECGLPVTADGSAAAAVGPLSLWPVTLPAPPSPSAPPGPAAPPDLRTPGRNQWYSDRFRAAADPAAASVGLTRGPARPATAGLFSDLPFVAPPLAVGWVVISGAWASVLAFLLPWASGLGYFDAWGLYKGSHLLAFFAAVAVALLAILPVRLPPLVRLALLPLLLGAFEFGLFWEWLGVQAIGPGVWLLLLGAILCVSGGIVVASRLTDAARPT